MEKGESKRGKASFAVGVRRAELGAHCIGEREDYLYSSKLIGRGGNKARWEDHVPSTEGASW